MVDGRQSVIPSAQLGLRNEQQDRDSGPHCHALLYTNSQEPAQSQHSCSRALSNASSRSGIP